MTRLDRLGRSLAELLVTVEDLKSRGIHLTSLEERIDTSSAAGELVFHVFGVIAHFERRLISERTREGLAAARRRGSRPGRPPVEPEKAAALRKLVDAGMTPGKGRQTARHRPIDRLQDRSGRWTAGLLTPPECAPRPEHWRTLEKVPGKVVDHRRNRSGQQRVAGRPEAVPGRSGSGMA